jgi:2-polyprenyl-3-methyl-5-hydroxy-6-metoxy-1,4-benzoquinol methylase
MGNEILRRQDDAYVARWIDENLSGDVVGDLGCGDGNIIYNLQALGHKVWGVDSGVDKLGGVNKSIDFYQEDLSLDVDLPEADIVISLEVGEHLSKDSEGIFIDNLVRPKPKHIIMSVATIGQEAKSHFNLQPRRLWIWGIERCGYQEDEALEYKFKKDLDGKLQVKKWYYWNIMIFNKT